VELDNGMRYVANFKYSIKPDTTEFIDIEASDYDKFDSDCSQTMVGFVQKMPGLGGEGSSLTDLRVQCFYGVQNKNFKGMEETESVSEGEVKYAKITAHQPGDRSSIEDAANVLIE
jgi:hypothetical protein